MDNIKLKNGQIDLLADIDRRTVKKKDVCEFDIQINLSECKSRDEFENKFVEAVLFKLNEFGYGK